LIGSYISLAPCVQSIVNVLCFVVPYAWLVPPPPNLVALSMGSNNVATPWIRSVVTIQCVGCLVDSL